MKASLFNGIANAFKAKSMQLNAKQLKEAERLAAYLTERRDMPRLLAILNYFFAELRLPMTNENLAQAAELNDMLGPY